MYEPGISESEMQTLIALLRRVCKSPVLDITPDMRLDDLPGMDSLRLLHAVAAMEEQFGVEIDVATLSSLRQVKDLAICIRASRHCTQS